MKKIILISITALLMSCTDEKGAKKTLENSGYTNVSVGGYGLFGGSKDDVYCTKFTATSPNGNRVTGVVTSGWFKGHTIRLD